MNDKARIVADVNIQIDTVFFPRSFGRRAFHLARSIGEVVTSPEALDEVEDVILRPKFDRFLDPGDRRAALSALRRMMTVVRPWCHYRVCRDPFDDKFIDIAVCAGAEAIISRDADLLVLSPFNGTVVEDARSFLARNASAP